MVAHSYNISMNGLYNGYMTASHRAAIPCPLSANITRINNQVVANRTYVLNTKAGTVYFLLILCQFYRYHFIFYLYTVIVNNVMLQLCRISTLFGY